MSTIMWWQCVYIKFREAMKRILTILSLLLVLLFSSAAAYAAPAHEDEKESLDVKEVIFHHLGDGYGWEVPFSHVYRIPLPVIVRAQDGQWFCFSSSRLSMVTVTEDVTTGKKHEELTPVVHKVERDGRNYYFYIPHLTQHKTKVVQLIPEQTADADADAAIAGSHPHEVADASTIDVNGKEFEIYRPFDISITKNVLALFIAAILVTVIVMSVVRYYSRNGMKAPRKGMGFMEMLIDFIYTGVIKSSLGEKAPKFAPYLLTCFFFILTMNLLGLIVIFPGGANLTGNIAITLVLAVATFVVTNVLGTKHYWKEIFWPDVPLFLKCPLPIMQMIEVFCIFTKPAALCVRLFANMMGGHMIVITLTLLIFIFAAFGAAALGTSVVVSVLFSIFMLLLDVLVSFIQAYVFTLLSALFISAGQESGHHHKDDEGHDIEPSIEA